MFIIETHFHVSDTWENLCTETTNGVPKVMTFPTKHEAQNYLDEIIKDSEEAYELGYLDIPYNENDLRISEVK